MTFITGGRRIDRQKCGALRSIKYQSQMLPRKIPSRQSKGILLILNKDQCFLSMRQRPRRISACVLSFQPHQFARRVLLIAGDAT